MGGCRREQQCKERHVLRWRHTLIAALSEGIPLSRNKGLQGSFFIRSPPGNNVPSCLVPAPFLPDLAGRLLASQTSAPRGSPSSSHLEEHFPAASTCPSPVSLRPLSNLCLYTGRKPGGCEP